MTQPPATLRCDALLPDPPSAVARLLEPALAEVAGEGAVAVSLTLDYADAGAPGEAVVTEAWVERATRSLVFAHARLARRIDGALLAQASAVFRRGMDGTPGP